MLTIKQSDMWKKENLVTKWQKFGNKKTKLVYNKWKHDRIKIKFGNKITKIWLQKNKQFVTINQSMES